jgi:DNA-binding MarR family transcriptional regulator
MAALAEELSRSWRELGSILASRRLWSTLSGAGSSALTPTKLRAVDLLGESGGLRIRELAAGMGIDETSATRLVDRLEAIGVAVRTSAPEDRRATVVVLTAGGEGVLAEMRKRRAAFFRDVLAALDPDERGDLVRLTAKATAALRARSEELVAR